MDSMCQLQTSKNRQRLRLLVDSLPASMNDVLVLVMFGGPQHHDAAEALGTPIGTVKSRIHNAIAQLRKIAVARA